MGFAFGPDRLARTQPRAEWRRPARGMQPAFVRCARRAAASLSQCRAETEPSTLRSS
jgi:hypothetical protein